VRAADSTIDFGMRIPKTPQLLPITMKHPRSPDLCVGFAAAICLAAAAQAQTVKTWVAGAADFYTASNWNGGLPDVTDIALINNAGTATIGATAGDRQLGTIRLGDTEGAAVSGHVIMNGGFLRIGETAGDPKPVIGLSATLSTFIMNGGTIFLDGPDLQPGNTNGKGVNELDWEVGEKGLGRFEMHGNAIFRASDDIKIAENPAGNGTCLIDGNARVSVGSGISISGNGGIEQSMVIGGNALVESGNSMGAGNPEGQTDEGYLTMAFGGSKSKLTIQDQGVLNIRRLTAREGTSLIIVKDRGQFHIFDVLNGKGFIDAQTPPDRPEETGPNSTFASLAPSDGTFILQDDAQMTVNSAQGLGISAPRDPGNTGGTARMTVKDRASLLVEQYLAVGTAAAESSIGAFEIVGPTASVSVGGNLNLACDPDGNPTPGQGTLEVTLTGTTQAKMMVGGIARIANGRLKIKTQAFTPVAGASFAILQAASFDGQFLEVDSSEASLPAGMTWGVTYGADTITIATSGGGGAAALTITSATLNGNNLMLSWTGGTPPFIVQRSNSLASGQWTDVETTSATQTSLPTQGGLGFVRVKD
jgi:hypothetical protein